MMRKKRFFGIAVFAVIAALAALTACSSPTGSTSDPVPGITITTHPADTELAVGGTGSLTMAATLSGGAVDIKYQWYRNTTASNEGGTLINGATTASYTIPAGTAGVYYYFCQVTATGVDTPKRSNPAKVTVGTVSNVPTITIDTDPVDTALTTGAAGSLTVEATLSGGATDIKYQWYSNTSASNVGGTPVNGMTTANFAIPTGMAGVYYYFCQVTATGVDTPVYSKAATVTVSAPVPAITITIQPESVEVKAGYITGTDLTIEASGINGASVTGYQWYSNTTAGYEGAAKETGIHATSEKFDIPTTLPVGVYYYFCEITASGVDIPKRSDIVTVTVSAAVPAIVITSDPVSPAGPLTAGAISGSLIVKARGDYGATELTYQWYKAVSANSYEGADKETGATATTDSFTIPTTLTAGTYYYFCEITAAGVDIPKRSKAATVTVKNPDVEFEVNMPPEGTSLVINREGENAGTSFGAIADTDTVFTATSGFVTYQWLVGGVIEVSETSDNSYTFNKAAGVYRLTVVVTDGAGIRHSAYCRVTVK